MCPHDIQEKISSHIQEKQLNEWYTACIDYYQYYSYDIWESWSTTIYFPNRSEVGGVSFPANSLSPNDPVAKAWEYGIIIYFIQFSDPKLPFFSTLTKFQQCMFKKIHQIPTSPDGRTKIPNNRCLHVEVHCALIEYENRKAKVAYYLVLKVDSDDPKDRR